MPYPSSGLDPTLSLPPVRPRYHAFVITPEGLVSRVEKLPATDDCEALLRAKALVNGYAVELWEGVRFIERLEGDYPASR